MAGLGFSFGLASMLARLGRKELGSGVGGRVVGPTPVSFRLVDLLGGESRLDQLVDRARAGWVRDASGRPVEYVLPLRSGGAVRFVQAGNGLYRMRVGDREFSRPLRFDSSTSRFVLELANRDEEPLVRGELAALFPGLSDSSDGSAARAGDNNTGGGAADGAGMAQPYRFLTMPVYTPRTSSVSSVQSPVQQSVQSSTDSSGGSSRSSFFEQMMPILLMLAMGGRFGGGDSRGRSDYPIIIG